jgi:hypothetical protein
VFLEKILPPRTMLANEKIAVDELLLGLPALMVGEPL